MVKRISCRVIRTKPLGKSSDALRRTSRSNHFQHKIGDVFTGTPQGKYASNPVTYTRLLDITSVSMDNGLSGRILDCYA